MAVALNIIGVISYLALAAWAFGYARGATNDGDGWDSPAPLLAAVFSPLLVLGLVLRLVIKPIENAGFHFQQKQLEKQKQRIAAQEKVRIELQEADKELERAFIEMDKDEDVVPANEQNVRRSLQLHIDPATYDKRQRGY